MIPSHNEPAINAVINTSIDIFETGVALGIRIIVGIGNCISTWYPRECARGREGEGSERGGWKLEGC